MNDLTCFKACDVRGEIVVNIDENIAYRIGRAVAQYFGAKSIVIGFDARETSPAFAAAASQRSPDAGADALEAHLYRHFGHAWLSACLKRPIMGCYL